MASDSSSRAVPGSSRAALAAQLTYGSGRLILRRTGASLDPIEIAVDAANLRQYTYTRFECPIEIYSTQLQEWALNPLILWDSAISAMIQRIGAESAIYSEEVVIVHEGNDALRITTPGGLTRAKCARHFVVRRPVGVTLDDAQRRQSIESVMAVTVLLEHYEEEAFVARGGTARFSVPLINGRSVAQLAPAHDIVPIANFIMYRWHMLPNRQTPAQISSSLESFNGAIKNAWSEAMERHGGSLEALLRNDRAYLVTRGPQAFNSTAFLFGAYITDGSSKFKWPETVGPAAVQPPRYRSWQEVSDAIRAGYDQSIPIGEVVEGRNELLAWLANDILVEILRHYNEDVNAYNIPLVRLVDQLEEYRTMEARESSRGATFVCSIVTYPNQTLSGVLKDAQHTPIGSRWTQLGVFRLQVVERTTISSVEEHLRGIYRVASDELPNVLVAGRLDQPRDLRCSSELASSTAPPTARVVWQADVVMHYTENSLPTLAIQDQPTLTEKYLAEVLEALTKISRGVYNAPLFGAPLARAGGPVGQQDSYVLRGVSSSAIETFVRQNYRGDLQAITWNDIQAVRAFSVIVAVYLEDDSTFGLKLQAQRTAEEAELPRPSLEQAVANALLDRNDGSEVVPAERAMLRSANSNPMGGLSGYPRPLLGMFVVSVGRPSPRSPPYRSWAAPTIGDAVRERALSRVPPVPHEVAMQLRVIRLEASEYATLVRRMILNRINAAIYVHAQLRGNADRLAGPFSDSTELFDAVRLVPSFAFRTNYDAFHDAKWWRPGSSEVVIAPYELGEGFGIFAGEDHERIAPRAVQWFKACHDTYGTRVDEATERLSEMSDMTLLETFLSDQDNETAAVLNALVNAHQARKFIDRRNEAASDLRIAVTTQDNYIHALSSPKVDARVAPISQVLAVLSTDLRMPHESELDNRHRRRLVSAVSTRMGRLDSVLRRNAQRLVGVSSADAYAQPIPQLERVINTLLRALPDSLSASDRAFLEGFFVQRTSRSDALNIDTLRQAGGAAPSIFTSVVPDLEAQEDDLALEAAAEAVPPPVGLVRISPVPQQPAAPAVVVVEPPAPVVATPAVVTPAPAPAPASTPAAPKQRPLTVQQIFSIIRGAIQRSAKAAEYTAAVSRYREKLNVTTELVGYLREHATAQNAETAARIEPALRDLQTAVADRKDAERIESEDVAREVDITVGPATGRSASANIVAIYRDSLGPSREDFDQTRVDVATDLYYAKLLRNTNTLGDPVIGHSVPDIGISHPGWNANLALAAFFAPDLMVPEAIAGVRPPRSMRDDLGFDESLPAEWQRYIAYLRNTRKPLLNEIVTANSVRTRASQLVSDRTFIDAANRDATARRIFTEIEALALHMTQLIRDTTERLNAGVADLATRLQQSADASDLSLRQLLLMLSIGQQQSAERTGVRPIGAALQGALERLNALQQQRNASVAAYQAAVAAAAALAAAVPKAAPAPVPVPTPAAPRSQAAAIVNAHLSLLSDRLRVDRDVLNAVGIVNKAKIFLDNAETAGNPEAIRVATHAYIAELWRSAPVKAALVELALSARDSAPTRRQGEEELCIDAAISLETVANLDSTIRNVTHTVSEVTVRNSHTPSWSQDLSVQRLRAQWTAYEQQASRVAVEISNVVRDLLRFMSSARRVALTAIVEERTEAVLALSPNAAPGAPAMAQFVNVLVTADAARSVEVYSKAIRARWAAAIRNISALDSSTLLLSPFWSDIRIIAKDGTRNIASVGSIRPRGVTAMESLLQLGDAGGLLLFDILHTLARSRGGVSFEQTERLVLDRMSYWPMVDRALAQPLGLLPIGGCVAMLVQRGLLNHQRISNPNQALMAQTVNAGASADLARRVCALVTAHVIDAYLVAISHADIDEAIRGYVGLARAPVVIPGGEAQRARLLDLIRFIRERAIDRINVTVAEIVGAAKPAVLRSRDFQQAATSARQTNPAAAASVFVAFQKIFSAELMARVNIALTTDLAAFANVANSNPKSLARSAVVEFAAVAMAFYVNSGLSTEPTDATIIQILQSLDVLPRSLNSDPVTAGALRYYFGGAHPDVYHGLGAPRRFMAQTSRGGYWHSVRSIAIDEGTNIGIVFEADQDPTTAESVSLNAISTLWLRRFDEDGVGRPRQAGLALDLLDDARNRFILPPSASMALAGDLHTLVASRVTAVPSSPPQAATRPALLPEGSPTYETIATPPHSPVPSSAETEANLVADAVRQVHLYNTEAARQLGSLEQQFATQRSLTEEERRQLSSIVSGRLAELQRQASALLAQSSAAGSQQPLSQPLQIVTEVERLTRALPTVVADTSDRVNAAFKQIQDARLRQVADTSEIERLARERREAANALLDEI
jgi:hypothetical protein